jgi:hypothetical protein
MMFRLDLLGRPSKSRSFAVLLAGCALALTAGISGVMVAAPASAASAGYIRLAHLSPDTPEVDVYITPYNKPDSTVVIHGVGYGTVSAYQRVNSGVYTIAMRPAGAAATTPAVVSANVTAAPGSAHTIAGVGKFSSLGLKVLTDDLTSPPAGQARVRVIQASARQPRLDVTTAGGTVVAKDARFATTSTYATVRAGTWKLKLTGDNGSSVTIPCQLAAAGVYSVIVLDGANGLRTVVRTDAQGNAVVPDKAIEAGLGDPAADSTGLAPALATGTVAVLLFAAGAVALWRRGSRLNRRRAG